MAEALTAVCGATATRTPKEILKCVRLEALSDAILLTATDLELGLRCAVTQVEVDKTGTVVVVADTLARIVRECPDEILTIEDIQNLLHLKGMGSHFRIVTQTPEDFPAVASLEGEADFSIDHAQLRRMVEWTVFAAARESTRYAINGVLWEVSGSKLTLAATDGRRLAIAHGKLPAAPASSVPRVIVPGRALSLLSRLPVVGDAAVQVRITSNQLLMKVGGSTIATILVEGHFPKYQDVIPADCDRIVEMNTMEFLGALKRAALLTNEESKGVRLSFSDGELTLSSRAPEQGEATISLPISYKGEPMDIGFNPVFLTDVLRVAGTEEIRFAFKEPNRPGILRMGDEFLHVVMPVNLSSA